MKLSCILLAALAGMSSMRAHAQEPVRKNVLSLTAQEVLDLRRAVDVMKSRDPAPGTTPNFSSATYRSSWDFWARIHGAVAVPANPIAQATFRRCDHDALFLAWHRVYLHYFERTLQKAVGVATLKVPYWNYTSGPQRSMALPRIFRDRTYRLTPQGAPKPNPLFTNLRRDRINNGNPMSAAVGSTLAALSQPSFDNFQAQLFFQPHGAVHCTLVGNCPTPLMGTPARAAEDAVFWPHHTNMDRLWNCWRKLHGVNGRPTNITSSQAPFVFADENGVLLPPMTAQQVVDFAESLNVKYQEELNCAEQPVPVPSPVAASTRATLGFYQDSTQVTPAGARLSLDIAPPAAASASVNAALRAPKRIALTIDLEYTQRPGPMYEVLVRRRDTGELVSVGIISFFGADAESQHHGHAARPDVRRFDVTNLFAGGVPNSTQIELEFKPAGGLEDDEAPTPSAAAADTPTFRVKSVNVTLEQ